MSYRVLGAIDVVTSIAPIIDVGGHLGAPLISKGKMSNSRVYKLNTVKSTQRPSKHVRYVWEYETLCVMKGVVMGQLACAIPAWYSHQSPLILLNRWKRYYVSVYTDWYLLAYERIRTQVPQYFIVFTRLGKG